jgi:hypothetical protein
MYPRALSKLFLPPVSRPAGKIIPHISCNEQATFRPHGDEKQKHIIKIR